MIEPHAKQAELNHYQSLNRLAERGGLCWSEALAVLSDRKWAPTDPGDRTEPKARAAVEALVQAYKDSAHAQ